MWMTQRYLSREVVQKLKHDFCRLFLEHVLVFYSYIINFPATEKPNKWTISKLRTYQSSHNTFSLINIHIWRKACKSITFLACFIIYLWQIFFKVKFLIFRDFKKFFRFRIFYEISIYACSGRRRCT